MLCARKRALQPNRRELQFSSLPLACPCGTKGATLIVARGSVPLAQFHPLKTPLRDALAARNCTSHLAFKTGSKPTACAASPAQHGLRAQGRPSTQSTRAAAQLVTVCFPLFVARDSVPLGQFYPRDIRLRVAAAARNCTSYRRPPAGAFAFTSATTSGRGFIPPQIDRRSSLPIAQPHPRKSPLPAATANRPN